MGLSKKFSYNANTVLSVLKTVDGSGSGLDADLLDGKHASELEYTLPAATASTLGGVKIGSGISIAADGTISSSGGGGGSYTLPAASATTLGGIKIGSGLTITNEVLSADSQIAGLATETYVTNAINTQLGNIETLLAAL